MDNMIRNFTFCLLAFVCTHAFSQNENDLLAINEVWAQFYMAFDSLDHAPMAAIHAKDLVRVSGGKRIRDHKGAIDSYRNSFNKAREKGITNKIDLRFFERTFNDSVASERGVYRLVRSEGETTNTYYGQFHVILKKRDGVWKIWMDYDSTENDTIGEDAFNEAAAIDDLSRFVKD